MDRRSSSYSGISPSYQRQMIVVQKLLRFHKSPVILKAVCNDGVSFDLRMKGRRAGDLQKLPGLIRIQPKSKGQLQGRIPGGIPCPRKQPVSEG
jgi:hypothetical protein